MKTMEQLLQELTRMMNAQAYDIYDKVFIIDIADVPPNMTLEDFSTILHQVRHP